MLLSSGVTGVGDDAADALQELPASQLKPGRHQPRRHFDPAALEALTDSIRAQGVVQPIIVRPTDGGGYEIVAGERRWRAAQAAGLKSVPVVIKTLDERGAMAVALVENIQRSDLNPLEEAEALHKLIEECGLTHEKAAEAVGRSRTHVTNLLRLTELNEDVQVLVRNGHLSLGHAKVLMGVQGGKQSVLAKSVVERQLSVRQTEALVQSDETPRPTKVKPGLSELEQQVSRSVGVPVRLQQASSGKGKLTLSFASQSELDRLLAKLSDR